MTRARKPKPLNPHPTERQVMTAVVAAARVFGLALDRQNTGAGVNPRGKVVRFGTPGSPDFSGTLPGGRRIDVETKAGDFDPARLRGEKRAHFDRQLTRMEELNRRGGVAFWVSDVRDFVRAMEILRDNPSAYVRFDPDGHPRFHH